MEIKEFSGSMTTIVLLSGDNTDLYPKEVKVCLGLITSFNVNNRF
jgi:hypothetical protein